MITWDSTRALRRRIRSLSTIHVLDALPDHLSWTEWRRLQQADVAGELGIGQASVSRAMAELLDLGLVERRGRHACIEWRLALSAGWRGGPAAYHAARRERGLPQIGGLPPESMSVPDREVTISPR